MGYLATSFPSTTIESLEYFDYFAHAYKLSPGGIPERIEEVMRAVGLDRSGKP